MEQAAPTATGAQPPLPVMDRPVTDRPVMDRLAGLPRPLALLAAMAAGGVASLGFEPVGSIAGPILGMAMLLLLLEASPRNRAFGAGLAFGFGHFLMGLGWIATAFTYQSAMPPFMGWVAVVGLSAFLALYPAIAAWAARRLAAGTVSLALLLAGFFIITEILRGTLFTGFSWNPLGAGWLQLKGVSALAAIIGANGLSGLAVLAGGSLAALVGGRGQPWRGRMVAVFPLLLLVGIIVERARPPMDEAAGTTIMIVQPDIGQDEKLSEGGHEQAILTLAALTRMGLEQAPDAVAIVWPEAAIEYPLEEMPGLRAQLGGLLAPGQLLLTGGVAIERDAGGRATGARNSLYALDSSGAILARHDKAHLVPGGEYLPLRWLAEPLGLARLVPGSLDFLPGPGPATYRLPGVPAFAPSICYEIIFPGAVAPRDDRPDFLLTISNDAWFGPSGPPQHHAQARLRAIEEGLPLVRVTPTGVSGFIGPRGELLHSLPPHAAATAAHRVPAPLPATPFARIGLWAPLLFALLLVGLGMGARALSLRGEARGKT